MKIYESQVKWWNKSVTITLSILAFIIFSLVFVSAIKTNEENLVIPFLISFIFYIFFSLVFIYARWKILRFIECKKIGKEFNNPVSAFREQSPISSDIVDGSSSISRMGIFFPMNYEWWEEKRKMGRSRYIFSMVFVKSGFVILIPILVFVFYETAGKEYGILLFTVFYALYALWSANRSWRRFEKYRIDGVDDYNKIMQNKK